MPDGPSDAEVSAYAAGRWPTIVRTLVLLGAPPAHAPTLAVEAVARCLRRESDEAWPDLDVLLAAQVVEAWERDDTAWWEHSSPDPGADPDLSEASDQLDLLDLLADLDGLAPAERARVVLRAVAGLSSEQLDDVLGPAASHGALGSPGSRLDGDRLVRVAQAVAVGEPLVREAGRRADDLRRRRRGRVVAGVVGAVLVAAVVGGLVLLVDDPPSAGPGTTAGSTGGPTSTVPTPDVPVVDLVPVPWYDGSRVHLADREVLVPDVRSMVRVGGGVAVVDAGGQVLLVRARGALEPLGVASGSLVADPDTGLLAWIDDDTDALVLHRLSGSHTFVDVAPGSRVVAVDGDVVQLRSGARATTVRADTDDPRPRPSDVRGLLDAAAGVTVTRGTTGSAGSSGAIVVETGPGQVSLLAGRDGWLSDDGRLLLTRDVGSTAQPPSVLVDVPTGDVVDLPLPAASVVLDSAFAADGTVTFVLARANGDGYPAEWPRDGTYQRGYDLFVCGFDASTRYCQQDARLAATDAPPLLAR